MSAKKRSPASGGDAGSRASSGKRKSSSPKRASADDDWGADGDDGSMFMPVPSFEGGGELDLGGAGPAWKTHDWQGETSARQRKKAKSAAAAAAARFADRTEANADPAARPGDAQGQTKKKKRANSARIAQSDRAPAAPVVNRAKPPKPEKKVKVDMRFGSDWDKKRILDEKYEGRREAKRQKYAAMRDAVAEVEGDDAVGAPEAEAKISGKILGRRRRAAEKRARAAEARRTERVAKGLPVDRPVKTLPAKLAVGTAAGVNALDHRSTSTGGGDGSVHAPATSARAEKNARRKARREKKAAEDAREAATPGGKTQKSSGGKEETPKERARREKREAAEELERRAAELRAAAEEDDSEEEEEEEEEEGDWGEQFSSDEDEDDDEDDEDGDEDEMEEEDSDVSVDEDEDAALDAALAASSDEDDEDDEDDDDEVAPESESESESEEAPAPAPMIAMKPGKMSLVDKMRAKLSGGQFRMLNETLYTTTGDAALKMVRESPGVFDAYHQGFREQTKEWPTRPVDACLEWLATQPASLTVADFGCGDAELARRATQKKVHSFDLESNAPGVTACNMASTPLKDASVDVAVFSLALMGTDYGTFLEEAHRVRPLATRVSPVLRVGNPSGLGLSLSRSSRGALSLRAPVR